MRRSFFLRTAVVGAALVLSAAVSAQEPDGTSIPVVRFTEIGLNLPGADDGQEFIELAGPPVSSLFGFVLVVLEGDGFLAGTVDNVYDLAGQVIGANGLYLRRDAATALDSGAPLVVAPGPNPATVLHVEDLYPDLENGTSTYLLLYGPYSPLPTVGVDWDADNNGALDVGVLSNFTVVDAVSVVENDAGTNYAYAGHWGFQVLGPFAGYTPDALYRERDCAGGYGGWRAGDLSATSAAPGPYFFSATNSTGFPFGPGSTWSLDPGRQNFCTFGFAISAPAGFGSLGFAITNGEPNAVYLTGLTFDPANATPAYAGVFGGLAISLDELLIQLGTQSAPFFGFLDATGAAASTYLGGLPPSLAGATIYGLTMVYSGTYGEFTGRSAIAALTL